MSSTSIGLSTLFLAAFIYGTQNIATRYTGIDFGPFLITFLRNVVVVAMLLRFVKWIQVKKTDWKWFALRAMGNVIATTCIFIAINKMSIGMALFSFYASMMLSSSIMGLVFYKEKITGIKCVSLAITVIGLALLNLSNTDVTFNWTFLIAILGGFGASLWSIFSRPISGAYKLPQLVLIDNILTGLIAISISFLLHEPWQSVQVDYRLLAVLYLGITQVFTGQLVAKGFKYVDAQIGSVILLNDSVVGMILAFLIYKETASLTVVLGGICIFLASIIPAIVEHKKGKV